jgi:hypothetical protein
MASGSLALTFKIMPWFINQRPPFNSKFQGQQFVKPTNYQKRGTFSNPYFYNGRKDSNLPSKKCFYCGKKITFKKIVEIFWQILHINNPNKKQMLYRITLQA